MNECRRAGKPHLVIDLAGAMDTASPVAARKWSAATVRGGVLNVAGPRASKQAEVYRRARALLWRRWARRTGDEDGPGRRPR